MNSLLFMNEVWKLLLRYTLFNLFSLLKGRNTYLLIYPSFKRDIWGFGIDSLPTGMLGKLEVIS
jgi:hypothetical protein